jgi:hypothetical protein
MSSEPMTWVMAIFGLGFFIGVLVGLVAGLAV